MQNQQYICCPDCNTKIPFDTQALIAGAQFSCPSCPDVRIGIDVGSRQIVQNTLTELDKVKRNSLRPNP